MAEYHYDVVVIGAGPAGEGAAMNAAKNGRRVAVIEDKDMVGGNCTHLGTIPSKALRHAVKQIITFNTNTMFRDIGEPRWFSFPRVLNNAERVIAKQVKLRTQFYARNRVDLFNGSAYFLDPHRIEVRGGSNANEILHAKTIVIATGSRPYLPKDVNFRHRRIYNSDSILKLSHTPRTLIIYGAGVIGCEYASIFAGLGVKVDLINPGPRLLSFLDDEISDALSYHLRNNGVLVRHNETYASVEG
ncbi:MAG: FAD-dependent oxidoreductase, partial [Gammaproteobacteria bacterium]|nr:FAD-dependent oxidoreductase [Gammaproteobacteria bacterium]